MTYIFRYFHKRQFYTHLAIPKNFPEPHFGEDEIPLTVSENEIQYHPHWDGEYKEVKISYLTIVIYKLIFGKDWHNQIEYELTLKHGYGEVNQK